MKLIKFIVFPDVIHAYTCKNKNIYINLNIIVNNAILGDKTLLIASIILLILHETAHHFIRFYSVNEEYQKLLFFTPEKELQDILHPKK